jgi:hypothetical protein
MFMIYLNIKFHMLVSTSSLLFVIEPKDKSTFFMADMLLLYILHMRVHTQLRMHARTHTHTS